MAFRTTGLVVICICGAIPATASASDKSWSNASTIGAGALVATAFVAPALSGDWDGGLQAAGSMTAAALISTGLKQVFPETRPDGSDRKSFPSMHTSISFAAAATLQNRYGWQVGAPAQLIAAFVGLSRVNAHKHYWYDVLAGAAIGEASGFLITSKSTSNVRVLPWGDTKGGGLAINMRF